MFRSMKYPTMFLWLGGAAVLYGIYASYGLPHAIFSYTFLNNGDRNNPVAERYYTSCVFVGPYGAFTVDAENGRCGWVRLFKERG